MAGAQGGPVPWSASGDWCGERGKEGLSLVAVLLRWRGDKHVSVGVDYQAGMSAKPPALSTVHICVGVFMYICVHVQPVTYRL